MRVAAIAAAIVLAAAGVPARAADPVQRVEVRLAVDGGEPHPLIVARIVDTVQTAAERLLVGRDSDLVARQEAALRGVLREVVDRVVRGYRVAQLGFQVGVTTVVLVTLQPRPPVLGEIPVVFVLQGVHPDAESLVRAALRPAAADLGRLPARLPVEALEWAGPLIERRIAEAVEAAAVGFTATGRVEVAPAPRVAATVTARDARIVRDIGIRFRTTSIPYVLLNQHAPQVTSMAELVRGLPVVFAAAHREGLERVIAERLAVYPPASQYAVVARPVLQVAETTFLTVFADSKFYRGRLEARLNFGTAAPIPDVRGQIGRAFGSLEPFVEFRLTPSSLAWRTLAGVRFDLGESTTIGYRARLDGEDSEPFVIHRLSPDLTFRAAYLIRTETFEGTVTLRITDFVSWEAVGTTRGLIFLSVVTNL